MKESDLSVRCRVELSDPGWQVDSKALVELVVRITRLIQPEITAIPGVRHAVAISCYFVPGFQMQELNRDHRGSDTMTDMLSFPLGYAVPGTGWVLGDVVICMDAVESKAVSSGNGLEDQLAFSLIHSVLHLVGFDHTVEHDRTLMEHREEEVFATIAHEHCPDLARRSA
ncbi:MAG: rRNA maturation RNase YbeY [Caldiserica bacterium]|nr:rRNA maturation RNase YbeY [Caldisericota bacterium]